MVASPARVGRPGSVGGNMVNRRLYSAVAGRVVEPSGRTDGSRGGGPSARTASASSSTSAALASGGGAAVAHAASSSAKGSQPQPSRPGSPFARLNLLEQQFTNPVLDDLWDEVGNLIVIYRCSSLFYFFKYYFLNTYQKNTATQNNHQPILVWGRRDAIGGYMLKAYSHHHVLSVSVVPLV